MPNTRLLMLIARCVEAGGGRTDTDAIRAADGYDRVGVRPWCRVDHDSGLGGALRILERAGLLTYGHIAPFHGTEEELDPEEDGSVAMGPSPVYLTEAGRRMVEELRANGVGVRSRGEPTTAPPSPPGRPPGPPASRPADRSGREPAPGASR